MSSESWSFFHNSGYLWGCICGVLLKAVSLHLTPTCDDNISSNQGIDEALLLVNPYIVGTFFQDTIIVIYLVSFPWQSQSVLIIILIL